MVTYFYKDENNNTLGPLSLEDLKKQRILKNTLIWYEGLLDWIPASEENALESYFVKNPSLEPIIQNDQKSHVQFIENSSQINTSATISACTVKSGRPSIWRYLFIIGVIIFVTVGVFAYNKFHSKNNYKSSSTKTNECQQVVIDCRVSTSSEMPPSGFLTFEGKNVLDQNLKTWWTPAYPNNSGINSWIQLEFDEVKNICGIEIHGGSHYPDYPVYGNIFFQNNRLTEATLVFSDGFHQKVSLEEIDKTQSITFPEHKTTSIKLVPIKWSTGTRWNDLCISHFKAIESITAENSQK